MMLRLPNTGIRATIILEDRRKSGAGCHARHRRRHLNQAAGERQEKERMASMLPLARDPDQAGGGGPRRPEPLTRFGAGPSGPDPVAKMPKECMLGRGPCLGGNLPPISHPRSPALGVFVSRSGPHPGVWRATVYPLAPGGGSEICV